MPYVTRDQVEARIAPKVLIDALDDDANGQEDPNVFDRVVAIASQQVDGYLAGLFTVPFPDPAPAKVQQAALIFTCAAIYERRNVEFPKWLESQVNFWRTHLERVGNRELPLDNTQFKAVIPGAVITENVSVDTQST